MIFFQHSGADQRLNKKFISRKAKITVLKIPKKIPGPHRNPGIKNHLKGFP